MARRQASLLSFCQSRESKEKADDDQDQESDDFDRQDVQVEDSPEESEHSCHDPSHPMSTLSPQFFGGHNIEPPNFNDLSAPEVVSHLSNNVLSDTVVYFECDFDDISCSGMST